MPAAHRLSTYLLLLLCFSRMAWADTPNVRFEALTIAQGLSQNTVFSIYQDRSGFMWFATAEGLNRYDGYQFKVFRHKERDPSSLANNLVSVLYQDLGGTLWVGTEGGGLQRYDKRRQVFVQYAKESGEPSSLSHNYVTSLAEDGDGRLWVGTNGGGVNIFDATSGGFIHLRHDPKDPYSLSDNQVLSVFAAVDGSIWVGTKDGGLNRYDANSRRFEHFRHVPGDADSLVGNTVQTIYQDSERRLWVGTAQGLSLYHPRSGSFSHFVNRPEDPSSIANNDIRTLIEDADGILWVGTYGGGLDALEPKSGRFRHHQHSGNDRDSLSHDIVLSSFQDATGLLWFGTWAGGVNKLDLSLRRFGHFGRAGQEGKGHLSHSDVSAVFVDSRDNLWVGTRGGGLNLKRPGRDGFEVMINRVDSPHSLGSNIVRAIVEDAERQLWVGTFAGGLNRLDDISGRFTRFLHDSANPDSIADDNVQAVLPDPDGRLWVGTWGGGLDRLDPKTGRFEHFRYDSEVAGSLSDDDVVTLFLDADNDLWVGTWGGGLNRFDRQSGQFEHYRWREKDEHSLSNDNVLSMYQDSSGRLWIGTYGGGLNRLDKKTGRFSRLTESDGLPNNAVYGILADKFDNLWLSTNRGLCKYNPHTGNKKTYGVDDGLQSHEFNIGAYFKSPAGELFFGGVNGFNRFFAETIDNADRRPRLAFTDMMLFNRQVPIGRSDKHLSFTLSQALDETASLSLSHRQSLVSFEFAALDFHSPMQNRYAYRLEGFDSDWIDSDPRIRRATYTNLPAGHYTLKVKAANPDGIWNRQGISLAIYMAPPWWFSWWAWCFYGLSGLFVLLWFIRAQRKKVVKERQVNRQLTRVNKLKDEFLANTSHELRTPLNGIIGLTESLIDGATGPLSSHTNANLAMVVASARRLSNLVNDILDFSKLQNRHLKLNIKPLDLHSMVDVVLTLSRPLVNDNTLHLINDVPRELPAVAADEDRLQQILHNLVGNAIKFTEQGEVRVSAKVVEHRIVVSVCDTGVGIAANKLGRIFDSFVQLEGGSGRQYSGTGLGLAVTKELVALHDGSLEVDSTPGQGSTFSFSLKLSPVPAEPAADAAVPMRLHQLHEEYLPDAPAPRAKGKFRLLVVDDEAVNRQVLFNHLSLRNYELVGAATGAEALALIEDDGPFDLVLLDIMMPKISGIDVCHRLRQTYPMSELPVIFLTARNQTADMTRCFAAGANDFLAKPVNKYELLSRVETHLSLLDINRTLERKVAQRSNELVHAEKMASLGTLTAGIAHEINNPTNFVQVSGQNLASDLERCRQFILDLASDTADDAIINSIDQHFQPLFEHLETISDGTGRLSNIVRDLQTFTQHDPNDKNMVDVRQCLQATINLVQTQKHTLARFSREFNTVPEIPCYPAQLNQVFMNLLVNACDAIEQRQQNGDLTPGHIVVSCRQEPGIVEISFKDNGCGFEKHLRSKLFEPFYTTKAVGKGTGLGLSIAYGIVQQHRGTLTVESMPGQGATFTIRLPQNNTD